MFGTSQTEVANLSQRRTAQDSKLSSIISLNFELRRIEPTLTSRGALSPSGTRSCKTFCKGAPPDPPVFDLARAADGAPAARASRVGKSRGGAPERPPPPPARRPRGTPGRRSASATSYSGSRSAYSGTG